MRHLLLYLDGCGEGEVFLPVNIIIYCLLQRVIDSIDFVVIQSAVFYPRMNQGQMHSIVWKGQLQQYLIGISSGAVIGGDGERITVGGIPVQAPDKGGTERRLHAVPYSSHQFFTFETVAREHSVLYSPEKLKVLCERSTGIIHADYFQEQQPVRMFSIGLVSAGIEHA